MDQFDGICPRSSLVAQKMTSKTVSNLATRLLLCDWWTCVFEKVFDIVFVVYKNEDNGKMPVDLSIRYDEI